MRYSVPTESLLMIQKQPPRGVLKKRYSENMQQIYRRIPMPKGDGCTSACVFSCTFAAYFQNTFSKEHLWMAASDHFMFEKETAIS